MTASPARNRAAPSQKGLAVGPWKMDRVKFCKYFLPAKWEQENFVRALRNLMGKITDLNTALAAIQLQTDQRVRLAKSMKKGRESTVDETVTIHDIAKALELAQQKASSSLCDEPSIAGGRVSHLGNETLPAESHTKVLSRLNGQGTVETANGCSPSSSDLSTPPPLESIARTVHTASTPDNTGLVIDSVHQVSTPTTVVTSVEPCQSAKRKRGMSPSEGDRSQGSDEGRVHQARTSVSSRDQARSSSTQRARDTSRTSRALSRTGIELRPEMAVNIRCDLDGPLSAWRSNSVPKPKPTHSANPRIAGRQSGDGPMAESSDGARGALVSPNVNLLSSAMATSVSTPDATRDSNHATLVQGGMNIFPNGHGSPEPVCKNRPRQASVTDHNECASDAVRSVPPAGPKKMNARNDGCSSRSKDLPSGWSSVSGPEIQNSKAGVPAMPSASVSTSLNAITRPPFSSGRVLTEGHEARSIQRTGTDALHRGHVSDARSILDAIGSSEAPSADGPSKLVTYETPSSKVGTPTNLNDMQTDFASRGAAVVGRSPELAPNGQSDTRRRAENQARSPSQQNSTAVPSAALSARQEHESSSEAPDSAEIRNMSVVSAGGIASVSGTRTPQDGAVTSTTVVACLSGAGVSSVTSAVTDAGELAEAKRRRILNLLPTFEEWQGQVLEAEEARRTLEMASRQKMEIERSLAMDATASENSKQQMREKQRELDRLQRDLERMQERTLQMQEEIKLAQETAAKAELETQDLRAQLIKMTQQLEVQKLRLSQVDNKRLELRARLES